jgi:putative ABC transport system ATP-binding protein
MLDVLVKAGRKNNFTVILITHNSAISEMADRVISVKNGGIQSIVTNKSPKAVMDINW